MYLRTPEPLAVSSKVVLSLPLEEGSHIQLKGIVIHAKSGFAKHHPGMGIKFTEVGDHEHGIIANLIKKAAD